MTLKLSGENYQKRLITFLQKEETKAYTMAILSFFALSFFTLFAIKPTLSTLFSLRKQIEDSSQVDKKLEEKINILLAAQEEYQEHKNDLNLIEEALPPSPQFVDLLRQIENLANEQEATISALVMQGFDFIGQKQSSQPQAFLFSLTISAPSQKAEPFLQNLMNLRRIIALESLQFSSEKEERRVELTLKGKAYYLP